MHVYRMRLLNTLTGHFVWIDDPSAVRYAILSHTWRSEEEGGEQSFADILELQTNTPPQWSATVQFSVDHSLWPHFLGQGGPVPTSAPVTGSTSAASPSELSGQEIPCADDSSGLHICPMQWTESGTLHARAEFVLHAERGSDRAVAAEGESDTGDTKLLRTPDECAIGRVFKVSVELSERYRLIGKRLTRALSSPPMQPPPSTPAPNTESKVRHDDEPAAKYFTATSSKDQRSLWVSDCLVRSTHCLLTCSSRCSDCLSIQDRCIPNFIDHGCSREAVPPASDADARA